MSVFLQKILRISRGLRASLRSPGRGAGQAPTPQRTERQQGEREGRGTGGLLEQQATQAAGISGAGHAGIRPENTVWIFGTARTGSTWLAFMMEELENQTVWREPYVGELFGRFYDNWVGEKHFETKHFILSRRHRPGWLRSVRNFVLDEAASRFPGATDGGYLVVKEPNGSIGAPLLSEALPESRMILLIRDPRDVAASALDAHRKGGWVHNRVNVEGSPADDDPDAFVESRAHKYLWYVGNSKLAYDAHEGPKALVRYEELRKDPLGTMRRMYRELSMTVDDEELARAVQKHAWEAIPDDARGSGRFYRKATPGGWREDLTPDQVETVERVTAPLLKEFYSYDGQSRPLAEAIASNRYRGYMLFSPTP